MEKKQFAFKGANYKEDCCIFLSDTLNGRNARLYPQGATILIEESEVEKIRSLLQTELGFDIRVFTPPISG